MLRIIFSYPTPIENELEKVQDLLMDNEIDFFHLRKPDFDRSEMKDYLNQIDERFHNKIVIHSHYDLISKFDVAGINLNKKSIRELAIIDEVDRCYIQPLVVNKNTIEVNRIAPEIVTYSAHSFDELNNLPFNVDYVFLSPIYDSISKQDYKSNFEDKNKLKQEINKTNIKVIALGGITTDRIDEIKELGFKGFAQLGSFWLV